MHVDKVSAEMGEHSDPFTMLTTAELQVITKIMSRDLPDAAIEALPHMSDSDEDFEVLEQNDHTIGKENHYENSDSEADDDDAVDEFKGNNKKKQAYNL
ncbi:hypothetical protein FQA39_LY05252 [Lamprigera yunnana]|nr:hypothetical protein FQA39_LY05252 [Lamprigera yunnana]